MLLTLRMATMDTNHNIKKQLKEALADIPLSYPFASTELLTKKSLNDLVKSSKICWAVGYSVS